MATQIAGLPFWELTFDADGDPDGAQRDAFLAEVGPRGVTDVIVFAHGWNNDRRIANELFTRFSLLTASELPEYAQVVARMGRGALGDLALADRERLAGRRVAVVQSGANADAALVAEVLAG